MRRSGANLQRADIDVEATGRGGPIDYASAVDDMVTYNGGRPLTCLAQTTGLHKMARRR